MSEMEMTNDVETEEFTDELSDESLDREGGGRYSRCCFFYFESVLVTDR